MNKNQKKKKGSIFPLIVAAFVIFMSLDEDADWIKALIIIGIVCVVIFTFIFRLVKNNNRKESSAQRAERMEKYFQRTDGVKEEAITCHCKHGREKYLAQTDEWYKNGLIEKEEYRQLKKHYQEIELPEGLFD